jgi:uridine kinase
VSAGKLVGPARVVLLAGPSGSGKSYIARRSELPVLSLDDFYADGDDPDLPRLNGAVDWESPASWLADEAVRALVTLCEERSAQVPVYDIGTDRRTGYRTVSLGNAPVVVAEGIFAAEVVDGCREAGVLADAVALRRPTSVTFARRLARDLAEGRKRPDLLVRRGVALARSEPGVLARQVALGCRPCSSRELLELFAGYTAPALEALPVS